MQTVGAYLPPLGYKLLACLFFAAMSLKVSQPHRHAESRSSRAPLTFTPPLQSRVFAILDARRPEMGSELGDKIMVETKRPSWTPPGFIFPIVWTTIGILRTVSSMLIWEASSYILHFRRALVISRHSHLALRMSSCLQACGRQMVVVPLIAMMTHLAIGDTWNCINNVEQRKGTAVAGVAFGKMLCTP